MSALRGKHGSLTKSLDIVFVGRRNGANRAAKALELAFRTLSAALEESDVVNLSPTPGAIAALTEAAVMPAARLRRRFGLGGLSVEAATKCTDKLLMKQAVHAAGIPCARFVPVGTQLDGRWLADRLGLPFVLKPRIGSGSRGARVVRRLGDLPARMEGKYLAESFVRGVEMSVESFVVDGSPVFTNFTAYIEPRWANAVPARLDPSVEDRVHDINRRAIAALGVGRGMTHMEVFVAPDGVWFGELAARPPGGHIMRLIELAYCFDPWQVLLQVESGGSPTLPRAAERTAGVRFIYPDAGIVESIEGLDTVRRLATAREVVCKLQPGDRVEARESTGQHRGFVIFAGSATAVESDLQQARDALRVVVARYR